MQHELIAALRRVEFLDELDQTALARLAESGQHRELPPRPLFHEGEDADNLYILLQGAVRIHRVGDDDSDITLVELGPGESFGEIALIDGGPRSASATVTAPSLLFALGREAFFGVLAASPHAMARVFSDLTNKVRENTARYVERELAARRIETEMVRQRHQALAQMVAGVAHEVNTPLGIMSTGARMIVDRASSAPLVKAASADPEAEITLEDLREAAGLLERNATRVFGLIQAFKSLSVGQVADVREPMLLPAAVEEIVELFRLSGPSALTVDIANDLPEGSRDWVGYRGYLTQVLLNLLTNVQRYAYPQGTPGRAIVRLALADQSSFTIEVRDFGQGIPAENLARVFDPFFTTGRGKGGTGLGLAIVKSLVGDGLRGTIAMSSEVGQGTTVTVTIPQEVPQ